MSQKLLLPFVFGARIAELSDRGLVMRYLEYSVAAAVVLAFGAMSANAATCIGNCGHSQPNGSIVAAPTGDGTYDWVSTYLGQTGAAQIKDFEGAATNGSELVTDAFFATAGSTVSFYFNYATSDGAEFADYSFAQLTRISDPSKPINLFTARTKPNGTIVPGTDLPAIGAKLTPATVGIIPGAPIWDPLGPSSGRCYSAGCGYTGWIKSDYTIGVSGSYQFRFGASNWMDTAYDSGLAFSGLILNGATVGDGSSASSPLLPTDAPTANGGFVFTFTPTPQQPIFVDPVVATGYTYEITDGLNSILSAVFPTLTGDADGYNIFTLGGDLLASGVTEYNFGSTGVSGFKLGGIDVATMLSPTDPMAFVTGLTFSTSNEITLVQTPLTTQVAAVPEPTTWAFLFLGFGIVGGTFRRYKATVRPRQSQLAIA